MSATTLSTAWGELAQMMTENGTIPPHVVASLRLAFYTGASAAIAATLEDTPPHAILAEVLAVIREEGVQ